MSHTELAEQCAVYASRIMEAEQREKRLLYLLERAADCLQDYCAAYAGDANDPLAQEIYRELQAYKGA